MANIIDMHRHDAAMESETQAAQVQRQRDQELLGLLESLERRLRLERREVAALRTGQALAEKDLEELRSLLQAAVKLAEEGVSREPGLPGDELAGLISRLNRLAASASRFI